MKNMSIKTTIFAVALLGVLLLAGCHRHHSRNNSSYQSFSYHTQEITQYLELNQKQQEQLERLFANLEQRNNTVSDGREIAREISMKITAENFDAEKVRKTISDYLDEIEEISMKTLAEFSTLHASLTAEQREKLTHLLSERKKPYRHAW